MDRRSALRRLLLLPAAMVAAPALTALKQDDPKPDMDEPPWAVAVPTTCRFCSYIQDASYSFRNYSETEAKMIWRTPPPFRVREYHAERCPRYSMNLRITEV